MDPGHGCRPYAAHHEGEAHRADKTFYVETHPDLQLHDVPARRSTDQPSSHVQVLLVERAHVPGLLIVVYHLQDVS